MKNKIDIHDRLLEFSVAIVRYCKVLAKDPGNRAIADQLLRSGTSVGANMQEADAAASKKDFIYKVNIAKKEIQETNYWLKLIKCAEILDGEAELRQLDVLFKESEELTKIIGAILFNCMRNSAYIS
jgi:four helix bundle protein